MNTPSSPEVPSAVLASLLASGFPFQTAVADVVRSVSGWSVVGEEIPWRHEGGEDQFLDIVATNGILQLVIECKKTTKETFTFLCPGREAENVKRARVMYLKQIADSTRRMELFCSEGQIAPGSEESRFCVVSTSDSGKNQRLLEGDAQRVVLGSDAFAFRYIKEFQVTRQDEPIRPILPVIVTNAKLFVARYIPLSVSLDSGQLDIPGGVDVHPVDWVRFTKGFGSWRGKDPGDRTVIVVRSSALVSLLKVLCVIGEFSDKGRMQYSVTK